MIVIRLSGSSARSTAAARLPATPLPMITWCCAAIRRPVPIRSDVLVEDLVFGDRDAARRADHVAGAAADALVVVDPDRPDPVPLGGLLERAVAAVVLDVDAGDQLDAVPGRHLDAGAAVNAVVRIDLVLVVAEIAALGLLDREFLVVALFGLERQRV